MTIQAVIFDMDGTLLDSERLYLQGFRDAATDTRIKASDALFISLIGSGAARSDAMLRDALGSDADRFIDAWRSRLGPLLSGPVPLKTGATRLLDHLAPLPRAVATSTHVDVALARLERSGLAGYFDVVIGGDQVKQGKPAPDIYLMAASHLGIAPTACAAFEDSETGTASALAAGMRVVQVPDMVPAKAPDAGQVVAETLIDGAIALGLMTEDSV